MSNLRYQKFVTFATRCGCYTLFSTLKALRVPRGAVAITLFPTLEELRGRDAAVRSTVKTIR